MKPDQSDVGLSNDPRWRRLWDRPWICAACGAEHRGVMDIAAPSPDCWRGGAAQPNHELRLDGDFLSEDFCVVDGQHYFVRVVLRLPIRGGGGKSCGFGVWSSLSRQNFERYVDTFDDGAQGGLGPWFGWLANRLGGFDDTLNLPCRVCPQPDQMRPLLEPEASDHPLSVAQRKGVTLDELLAIHAANGHDFRASLTD